jgi:glycosyltransferase involved in cell wall biosynthesis
VENLINFIKESRIDIAQSNYLCPNLAIAANITSIPHIWFIGCDVKTICPDLKLKQIKYFLGMINLLSQKIICASRFIKRQFKNIETTKIRVIYNGVDFEEANKIHPNYKLLERYGYDDNHMVVGMIANLTSQKRHVDFISAAKRVKACLPETKFFIIGLTHPVKDSINYEKYLRKKVKDIGMNRDVLFIGFYSNIFEMVSAVDLIVLPSIGEGLGVAILEAMAKGKSVVASDSGGIPELVKDRITGLLVPPKSPEKLAEAIIYILKNPRIAQSMGRAGRKRARRLFDIKKIVKEYEKLYLNVINMS